MEAVEAALGRLEGVKKAKVGDSKFEFEVRVLETKALLPSAIQKALTDPYEYLGAVIEVSGVVEKSGEDYVLVARASKQKYVLRQTDDVKKLLEEKKTKLTLTGKLTEPPEKDGKRPPPEIEVTDAKETKEKK